jgi:hypothetical protein
MPWNKLMVLFFIAFICHNISDSIINYYKSMIFPAGNMDRSFNKKNEKNREKIREDFYSRRFEGSVPMSAKV